MENVITVMGFVLDHWTALMATIAAVGHFFAAKTVIAKLGDLAAQNEAAPPAALENGMAAAEARLNQ